MSKTTGTTLGGGLISYDRRINKRFFSVTKANVTRKRLKYTRNEIKTLPSLSNLSESADAWNLLTEEIKADWSDAGNECGLSAYNLFFQDKIYRIINNISGNATPNLLHQYKVGYINIPESSGHFLLRQNSSFNFNYPAYFYVNAKTDLTDEDPGNGYLTFRFKYNYLDGATEYTQTTELNVSFSSDWTAYNTSVIQNFPQNEHWESAAALVIVLGIAALVFVIVFSALLLINNDPYCNKQGLSFFRLIVPEGVYINNDEGSK